MVAAFEPVGNCVKTSQVCEARVLVFFLIVFYERLCSFLVFFVLLLSSSGTV